MALSYSHRLCLNPTDFAEFGVLVKLQLDSECGALLVKLQVDLYIISASHATKGMLPVYKGCTAVCASLLALFLFALTLHGSATCHMVAIFHSDSDYRGVCDAIFRKTPNGTTPEPRSLEVREYTVHVDACVCLAGLCAGLFSIVYSRLEGRSDPEGDSAEAVGTLLVWAFATLHYASLAALVPLALTPTVEGLALRCLAHIGGMAIACGLAGRPQWTLALAVLPAYDLAYTAASVCTQSAVATVTVQAMLDVLLLMGHRWDAKPMLSAVLNCWIFYIAACGCLLLQVVLVSSLS